MPSNGVVVAAVCWGIADHSLLVVATFSPSKNPRDKITLDG